MRWLLLLAAWPLLALDNGVVITDAATATHTGRPILIHRWFARGEIANYARPRVGGSALTVWQCDVKSRWDDGSVRVAYVAWRQDIASGGSVTADFVNDTNRSSAGDDAATNAAAMDEAAMLAASWNGIVEGALNSVTYTANARTMVTAGKWSYYLRGPVATWVVAEDRTTALSYDFGWQYSGGAWQAPTGEQYKSLHPVFTLQFWPEVGAHSAWPGVEVDAILYNASTTRLQRIPLDKLRVLTGAEGTTESYCAGTGCSVSSAGTPNMIARRSWHAVVWSGTAPDDVVVDFNLPYMVYSKALLPYDTTLTFAQSKTDAYISGYDAMVDKPEWCSDTGGCYLWTKSVPDPGGRQDIAPVPAWYMYYLYGMGDATWTVARKRDLWSKMIHGAADAGTTYPIHYLETGTRTGSRAYFDDAGTVAAFGRVVSVKSRPTVGLRTNEPEGDGGVSALDAIVPVCSTAPCTGTALQGDATYAMSWTSDLAHQGSMFFLPALLTGRPFYIWEQYQLSTFAALGENPERGHGDFPYWANCGGQWYGHWTGMALRGANSGQLRTAAWATREMLLGALIAPDADPEQAYFAQRIRDNDAAWEGTFGVTDGLYPPTDSTCATYAWDTSTDPWCLGKNVGGVYLPNPIRIPYGGPQQGTDDYPSTVCGGFSPWQAMFLYSTASWIERSGVVRTNGQPAFSRTRREMAVFPLRKLIDADAYPYSIGLYNTASTTLETGRVRFLGTHAEIAAKQDYTAILQADITSSATTFVISSETGGMRKPTEVRGWTSPAIPLAVFTIGTERILACRMDGTDGAPRLSPATLTICPNGRGAWGTTAAAHTSGDLVTVQHTWHSDDYTGGWSVIATRVMATLTDVETGGYSGRKAWERAKAIATPFNSIASSSGTPMWAFRPSRDPSNVRAVGLSGSARLTYNAPDLAACKYTVQSSMTSSEDTTDTADSGGPVARSVSVSLLPGTYKWRITCGTGRAIGSVVVQ